MLHKHPIEFFPVLSDDKLGIIATQLLDIRYSTIREMNSSFDDNYTRETAVFGRTKNMIIKMAQSRKYDWMSLNHAGMDVTFNIGEVPCRFFRDDPNSPEKLGFFKRNAADDLFATDDQYPVMWRFIVEKALAEESEDRVYFVGYNVFQEKISEWVYRATPPMLHSVDQDTPPAVDIPAPHVDTQEDQADKDNNNLNIYEIKKE